MHLSDCPSKPLLFSGYGLNSVSLSVHFELLVQAVKLLPQYVEKHSTKNSRAARNLVASLLWVGGCRSSDFIFQYGNRYGVKEDMHGVTDGDSGLEQCPVTPRDQSLGSTASATATSNSEWLKCSGSLWYVSGLWLYPQWTRAINSVKHS